MAFFKADVLFVSIAPMVRRKLGSVNFPLFCFRCVSMASFCSGVCCDVQVLFVRKRMSRKRHLMFGQMLFLVGLSTNPYRCGFI